MGTYSIILAAVLAVPTNATAQEEAADPARASDHRWSAAVSVAAVLSAAADDQLQATATISRQFAAGHLGISISHADTGRLPGILDAVPARATQISLSGGVIRGAWSIDGYLTAGRRHFERELVGPNGSRAQIRASGHSQGAGLSVGRSFSIGSRQWLTPYVAADLFSVDTARTVTTAAGASSLVRERNRGVSGTLGMAWHMPLSPTHPHSITPYAAMIVSSDNSAFSPGSGGQALANLLAVRGGGTRDLWSEAGANAALYIAPRVTLTVGAARTFGYTGPELVTVQGGLAMDF